MPRNLSGEVLLFASTISLRPPRIVGGLCSSRNEGRLRLLFSVRGRPDALYGHLPLPVMGKSAEFLDVDRI